MSDTEEGGLFAKVIGPPRCVKNESTAGCDG